MTCDISLLGVRKRLLLRMKGMRFVLHRCNTWPSLFPTRLELGLTHHYASCKNLSGHCIPFASLGKVDRCQPSRPKCYGNWTRTMLRVVVSFQGLHAVEGLVKPLRRMASRGVALPVWATERAISSSFGDAPGIQKAVSQPHSVQKVCSQELEPRFKRLYAFRYAALTCVTRSF